MLYIKNATLYTPDQVFDNGAVLTDGCRTVAVGRAEDVGCPVNAEVVDVAGMILAPGFIDLQLNGAFGDDFTTDPASIWHVADKLPRYGVTSFLPTIISSPPEHVAAAQMIVCGGQPDGFRGARPLGLHVEGPFLNPQKKGAHNPKYLRLPSLEAVAGWSTETGVRMVTMAPELPGALDVIRVLSGKGVLVSEGHSLATYEEALAGIDAGARYATHLFNAMARLGQRDPGVIGALLTDKRVTVGFIADGVHTHPAVIRLVWQVLGSERLNLVTDAVAALGMPAGRHTVGEIEVTVDATSVRMEDGTLAGSNLSLDQALRNLLDTTGCSLADALPTITTTPALALGLQGRRGRIGPGYIADMTLLTPNLGVAATITEGQMTYIDGWLKQLLRPKLSGNYR